MLPGDSASDRKARGAFFTPAPVARFIADWAVHSPSDSVLEPSCGEAVFLHEAGRSREHSGQLVGVELHADSAAEAERTLRTEGIAATIESGDFFLREPTGSFDAVIGNPPYIRYQDFSGEARARSRAAALRAGVSLTGLASSWAAFTIHSALHLKADGRLGLVLPAELLTVNYAASVRQFLMDHFKSVGLVLFVDRVFPGVSEEVILLLADGFDPTGAGGTDHCDIFQVRDVEALNEFAVGRKWAPHSRGGKWSASLVPAPALDAYTTATMADGFDVLETWGDTTLGMVTGNNKFFTLAPSRVAELRLLDSDVVSLSPPGSRHLRNLTVTSKALGELGSQGSATWLFRPTGQPSAAASRYIAMGEKTGVDTAYKCRVRKPWWLVPYQPPADLLLTYMNADTPRLCTNRAATHHLNSVHGVYLAPSVRKIGMDLLPIASLNSVTLLGAETVGRAYGGGILKVEPKEADQLPMPAPDLVVDQRKALSGLRPRIKAHLQRGQLLEAVREVDEVLLIAGLGMSPEQLAAVRTARADMAARRIARGKEATAHD